MTTKSNPLVSTAVAAGLLGITVAQFTGLMTRLGIRHDHEYTNPHYRSGPPAKLWARKKLFGIKRRKAFKTFLEGAARRSARAKAAVGTKEERLMEECSAWAPIVKVLPLEDVVTKAIDAYNDYGMWLGRFRDSATRYSAPEFLFRITTNYIRHNLTDYEARLASIRGRVGTGSAYEDIIRPIVDDAVEVAYAGLAAHLGFAKHMGEGDVLDGVDETQRIDDRAAGSPS